jgi:hypothetical protein
MHKKEGRFGLGSVRLRHCDVKAVDFPERVFFALAAHASPRK